MRVRATASRVEVWAPAKLNLFLGIRGKRSDGYHEIETLMVPIALYDTLFISPTEPAEAKANIQLTVDSGELCSARNGNDSAPTSADNTIVRALYALRAILDDSSLQNRARQSVVVRLMKRIPVAAGLAGGSTDAAAALLGVAKLWGIAAEDRSLFDAACQVGSDIPFFLQSGAAICRGRGELVSPAPLPRLHFVVVKPNAGLATAEVYRKCQPDVETASVEDLVHALWNKDRNGVRRAMHNGLQAAAEQLSETVEEMHREFDKEDVIAHQLSGSGTSYFGVCGSAHSARKVAARLKARRVGRVFAVSSCL